MKQPVLRNFFATGNGDLLVSSVEKNHACVIHVQKQGEILNVTEITAKPINNDDDEDSDDDDDDDDDGDGDDDVGEVGDEEEGDIESAVSSVDSSTLVTGSGHKISWRAGNIETQKVC